MYYIKKDNPVLYIKICMTEIEILLSSEKAIKQSHRIDHSIVEPRKDLSKSSDSTHCSSRYS